MKNRQLYNSWAATYDAVENKTRDLERIACEQILSPVPFETVIELGCGTGKNTGWLAEKARRVIAVDLSEEMQAVARDKVKSKNVSFEQADITKPWDFGGRRSDLLTCSLILEHVENLDFIFGEAFRHLTENGYFYVCELHPFRQYLGSRARFETEEGEKVLDCYTHHVSDYVLAALANNFSVARLDEWFDENDRTTLPRLISFLFRAGK